MRIGLQCRRVRQVYRTYTRVCGQARESMSWIEDKGGGGGGEGVIYWPLISVALSSVMPS